MLRSGCFLALLLLLVPTPGSASTPATADSLLREDLRHGRALEATLRLSERLRQRYTDRGADDPTTLDTMIDLALLAEEADQQSEAQVLLSTALDLARARPQDTAPQQVRALAVLARLWRGQSRAYAERARAAYAEGLEKVAGLDGADALRADLWHARSNQARAEGDLAGAEAALDEAIALSLIHI